MGAARDLTELVRSIYLNRRSGFVEVRHSSGTDSLFFRRGELFLDRDHDAAVRISPLLASATQGRRPAAVSGLRREVEELARRLSRLHGVEVVLQDERGVVAEVIGPVPTVCFVQELAVHGSDDEELLALLGGGGRKLRSSDKTPALEQLPELEPEMTEVLAGLENPVTAEELLRGAAAGRLAWLRGLVKLWAVGLVEAVERPAPLQRRPTQEILTPKLLDTFAERVDRQLDEQPIELDPQAHRLRVADLLGRLGSMNHYELLGIDLKVDDDGLLTAYNELARFTHPRHAPRLGLVGRDEPLRILFERATEAYLTLSDPRRRASYNTVLGIHANVQVGVAQREQEKQTIARHNYQRAAGLMAEMDYSQAVELLKEAARLDPRPEYFVRLGLAQSKNPKWRHHALESYRRAIELGPDDAGIRFSFASLLEDMDRGGEAREQYQQALELMPGHVGAREGLERLGGSRLAGGVKSRTASFRNLFGRGQSSGD